MLTILGLPYPFGAGANTPCALHSRVSKVERVSTVLVIVVRGTLVTLNWLVVC